MEMTPENYWISLKDIITSCLADAEMDAICAKESLDTSTYNYYMDRLTYTHHTLRHIIRHHVNEVYAPHVYRESLMAARKIRRLIEDTITNREEKIK